nr:hypothetical protein [uncultured Albidiferax sp.]
MKIVHCLSIASVITALVLFLAGFSKVAGLVFGLTTVAEILASAITGKQKNAGTR